MLVDCDRCEVRGEACQDCVITVLLGAPPSGVDLDGAERRALYTLAEAGMVPHLQLVDRRKDHDTERDGDTERGGVDVAVPPCDGAERTGANGERPIRHVS